MKLRISKNFLRLRLTKSEVESFAAIGKIEEKVSFPDYPENILRYSLEKADISDPTASFENSCIRICVPASLANEWAAGKQVGIEGKNELESNAQLRILIEKDFAFLKPKNEDDSDNYPHPLKSVVAG